MKIKEMVKRIVEGILLISVILIIWEISSRYANPLFVPKPMNVYKDFIYLLESGDLFKAVRYSFLRITAASVISGLIAIPTGLLIYNSGLARGFLYPIVKTLRYIPVTAFYPLLMMWFGIDEKMKIAFLFIATFVYMMPTVLLTLEELNQDLIDTGLTIGMNKLQIIWRIQIPSSLPSLMNSFVMMYGIGWTYIAVAETINARYGLGWIIQQSTSRGRTDMVFMAIICIVVISLVFDMAAKFIIRRIFKWRYINDTAK